MAQRTDSIAVMTCGLFAYKEIRPMDQNDTVSATTDLPVQPSAAMPNVSG